jgi:hypothetical protein
MSKTEEARTDPSAGKSGASPSAPGPVKRSTVMEDPTTDPKAAADSVPQASPVPDVIRALEESRKPIASDQKK